MSRTVALLTAAALLTSAGCGAGDDDPRVSGPAVASPAEPSPAVTRPPAPSTPPPPRTAAPPAPAASPTDAPAPVPAAAPTPQPLIPPADLATVVAELAFAERTLRNPGSSDEEAADAGRRHQHAVWTLTVRPEWRDRALASLPDELRPEVEADVAAAAALRGLHRPQPRLPSWRIVPPAPAAELLAYYQEAEAAFGVPWQVLAAIHLVETRMGRIRGTSSAGARGPMQFMPATWAAYGKGDIENNRDAILAAARYLRASGAPGDLERAVFAYNRDRRYVDAILAHADAMTLHPSRYRGYHAWQVHYMLTGGDVLLPEGWDGSR